MFVNLPFFFLSSFLGLAGFLCTYTLLPRPPLWLCLRPHGQDETSPTPHGTPLALFYPKWAQNFHAFGVAGDCRISWICLGPGSCPQALAQGYLGPLCHYASKTPAFNAHWGYISLQILSSGHPVHVSLLPHTCTEHLRCLNVCTHLFCHYLHCLCNFFDLFLLFLCHPVCPMLA